MLSTPRWLALEVKYLDRALSFYRSFLDLEVRHESATEAALAVGETDLILREPGPVPRGGLHTHYAMSIPDAAYDDWWDRLEDRFDLVEHRFGEARSLYFYDMAGNCVELGQSGEADGEDASAISGLFEIVLEVEDLELAEDFYDRLGFEVTSRGDERERVRMTTGDLDLELWEPHLGLADARGGVHVDFGVAAEAPQEAAVEVAEMAMERSDLDDGVRIRDPDGHYVTLVGT
ncbi:VOC family protein [Halobacteriales archaeon Cl-PHB]